MVIMLPNRLLDTLLDCFESCSWLPLEALLFWDSQTVPLKTPPVCFFEGFFCWKKLLCLGGGAFAVLTGFTLIGLPLPISFPGLGKY